MNQSILFSVSKKTQINRDFRCGFHAKKGSLRIYEDFNFFSKFDRKQSLNARFRPITKSIVWKYLHVFRASILILTTVSSMHICGVKCASVYRQQFFLIKIFGKNQFLAVLIRGLWFWLPLFQCTSAILRDALMKVGISHSLTKDENEPFLSRLCLILESRRFRVKRLKNDLDKNTYLQKCFDWLRSLLSLCSFDLSNSSKPQN